MRKLYNKYHDEGFELLAFPANQFGCQAPGTSEQEREYAWKKFGFEFPVMDKIAVKYRPTPQCVNAVLVEEEEDLVLEDDYEVPKDPTPIQPMSPVYEFLKQPPYDKEIEWNYVKFLIGRDGQVLRRYNPAGPLEQGMEADVQAALKGEPMPTKRKLSASDLLG